jgi:hypothetical protein
MRKEELSKLRGEIDNPFIGRIRDCDNTDLDPTKEYVKVFVSRENRLMFASLSPRSVHLFFWVALSCIKDCDLVYIDRHKYMEESGVSRQETYMDAIKQLIEARIIAKAPKGVDLYFINPHVFFRGNRLNKYRHLLKPENVRVVSFTRTPSNQEDKTD